MWEMDDAIGIKFCFDKMGCHWNKDVVRAVALATLSVEIHKKWVI